MSVIQKLVGASSTDIAEQLKTIDGVREVNVKIDKDNEDSALDIMRVEVSAESSLVKGEDIFEWALKKKLKLRERISLIWFGSNPEVGSSKIKTSGLCNNA
jgi:copper chaperone CopZ